MKKRHNKMIAILSMVLVLGIGSATVFAEKAPEITVSISEELERNGLPEGNISKEKIAIHMVFRHTVQKH